MSSKLFDELFRDKKITRSCGNLSEKSNTGDLEIIMSLRNVILNFHLQFRIRICQFQRNLQSNIIYDCCSTETAV